MCVPPFMLSMILLLTASISNLLSLYDYVCQYGSSPIAFNSLFFPSITLHILTIELQRKSMKNTYNIMILPDYSLGLPSICFSAIFSSSPISSLFLCPSVLSFLRDSLLSLYYFNTKNILYGVDPPLFYLISSFDYSLDPVSLHESINFQ